MPLRASEASSMPPRKPLPGCREWWSKPSGIEITLRGESRVAEAEGYAIYLSGPSFGAEVVLKTGTLWPCVGPPAVGDLLVRGMGEKGSRATAGESDVISLIASLPIGVTAILRHLGLPSSAPSLTRPRWRTLERSGTRLSSGTGKIERDLPVPLPRRGSFDQSCGTYEHNWSGE
jgi:hypothetical protein